MQKRYDFFDEFAFIRNKLPADRLYPRTERRNRFSNVCAGE
jgi:hypothetical protein